MRFLLSLHKDTQYNPLQHPTLIHLLAGFSATSPEHTLYSARLMQTFPGVPVIYSYQPFIPGEIISPSVFLRLVESGFPEGTMHFCLIQIEEKFREKYLLAKYRNCWFFAPDNGLLPLALPFEVTEFYRLPYPEAGADVMQEIYLPGAVALVQDGSASLTDQEPSPVKLLLPSPTRSGDTVRLTVLYTDANGNAYLNINRSEFESLVGTANFKIRLGYRDEISQLSKGLLGLPMGQKAAFFGMGDLLQIAVNCGSAEQYLGLVKNKVVMLQIDS